jgi:ankyrin repeat protein/type II secretory pathway predicted ATPase ExeA
MNKIRTGLREDSFDVTPSTRFSFASREHEEAFNGFFLALLARRRIMALIGEAGTGKTTLLHALIEHVEADGSLVLAVTSRPQMTVEDLIQEAGSGFEDAGTDGAAPSLDQLVERIEERLDEAGTGVMVVDEAHNLDPSTLQDLFDLAASDTESGRFLQILLCGTPQLERLLAEPGLDEAMHQMGVTYFLPPLDPEQVDNFVRERLRLSGASDSGLFDADAIAEVAALSGGIVASINILSSIALRDTQRAGERSVTAERVRAAAAELGMKLPAERRRPAAEPSGYTEIPEPAPPPRPRMVERAAPDNPPPFQRELQQPDQRAGRQERPTTAAGWAEPAFEPRRTHQGAPDPDLTVRSHGQRPPVPLRRSRNWPWVAAAAIALLIGAGAGAALVPSRPLDRIMASLTQARSGLENPTTDRAPIASSPTESPDEPSAAELAAPAPGGSGSGPTQQAALPPETMVPQTPAPPSSLTAPPLTAPPLTSLPPQAPGASKLAPLPDRPTATPAPPPPDPAIERQVAELVQRAQRYIGQKSLTTPAGANAFDTVQQIRQIDPDHPKIDELLGTLRDTYLRWGQFAEQRGELDNAESLYRRGLTVIPGDATLALNLQGLDQKRRQAAAQPQPQPQPPPEQTAETTPVTGPDQVLKLPPDYYERETAANAAGNAAPNASTPAPADNRPLPPPNNFSTRDEMIAAFQKPELLQSVIRAGRDLNRELPDGKTPLMVAAEQGFDGAVRQLLAAGAAPNARSRNGGTALMYAASIGNNNITRALLQNGGAVNAMNVDGKTALMAAAARGNVETVRTLIENGANVGITNIQGRTALSYAEEGGFEEVARLLRDRGAPQANARAGGQAEQSRSAPPQNQGPIDLRSFRGRNELGQLQ